ncbi:MAG TPA: peptide-N4-asparagine amidase [Thermoplasmata archaeon]|nr:peptide-N4-asparagine amidase [Thermoplasmata archaeon]
MRRLALRATLAAGLFLLGLFLVPPASPGSAPPLASPAGHAVGNPAPPLTRALASPVLSPGFPLNETLGGTGTPSASGNPSSVVYAEPSPPVPNTIPVMMYLLNASRSSQYSQNLTAPAGTWARIVLNYTGVGVNGVFDSSYRGFLDRSMVLFGTTPEYGQWTVLQDLTEYSVLFHGVFNLTFLLGVAVPPGGYFLTSLSLAFYPVPAGSAPPSEPMGIAPLWYRVSPTSSAPIVYVDTVLPTNITNATLELYAYGLNTDEFWYLEQPGLREVQVFSNGTQIASVLPFTYINTGGILLFTWRPITGAFTLEDRPYRLNLTGALGLLEGARNLTVRVNGISPGATWFVGGSILYDTAPTAGVASSWTYSVSNPAPTITSDGVTYYDETATASVHYGASWGTPGGPVNVSTWANESYSRATTLNQHWLGASWNNTTSEERMTLTSITTGPSGDSKQVQTFDFPLAMDGGSQFIETSSTGGTYPIYGNFTTYLDNVVQEWNETQRTTGTVSAWTGYQHVDDRLTGGVNIDSGYEELLGPGAGLDISHSLIETQTTKLYSQLSASPTGGGSYTHLVIGAAYQPTTASLAETILTNVVSSPLFAGLATSQSNIDLGGSATFSVDVSGGTVPYTFSWVGLPPGCTAANASILACTPTTPGSYSVSVVVSDASGALAATSGAALTVNPSLSASVQMNVSALDVGQSVSANASLTGGSAPYTCRWSVSGGPWGASGTCGVGFTYTAVAAGSFHFSVQVTDGIGASFTSSSGGDLTVSDVPSVSIEAPSANATAVGSPLALTAFATGGSGNLLFTWTVNGTAVSDVWGPQFTFVPTGPGAFSISVSVRDSTGASAMGGSVSIAVSPASPPAGPSTGSGTGLPGGLDWTAFLVIGLGLGLVAGLVIGVLLSGKRRPPARRVAARPAAPPSQVTHP